MTAAERTAETTRSVETRTCDTCEQARPVAEVSAMTNARGYVAGWQCQHCDERIAYAAMSREA